MTSKVDQEMTSHDSPPKNGVSVERVEPGTESTVDETMNEGTNEGERAVVSDPAALQAAEATPSTPKTEETSSGCEEEAVRAEPVGEKPPTASAPNVESDPSSVPSPPADSASHESPAAEPQTTVVEATSSPSVASPAVVVDVESEILDDMITSPTGENAIVERSPGGRYVRFMEKLGSGASKDVYRAYDTQEGIEVAWNVVHLAGVPKNERNRIVNEVRLLERLHHHNIISFHGSWVNRERQQVNFVTEILSSGTLKSFINKVQVIRWKIAKRWAVQILKGLEYLHSQDPPVIHRDLKCENIFINGTSGDLRIGDLGLSTVHRNGKVLSVLGTPEFMAPDMYEENAYDHKVDIYAFGMCLLEIFTNEIPYRECSNPAQIYKKVTNGDPPGSLKRLKSRHAREFIELCLGTKDEDGNYVRPSATELLEHEFLQNWPTDDDEVEVDPPFQERAIRETNTESSSAASPGVKGTSKGPRAPSSSQTSQNATSDASREGTMSRAKLDGRSNSLDEDESDRFEEMPDSEVNIRKVKVMMGRGQELKEDDEPVKGQESKFATATDSRTDTSPSTASQAAAPVSPVIPSAPIAAEAASNISAPPPTSTLHYLVAAAVIENEQSNERPYEDGILKLVVTLPVEGQTQNVQFDFHLVEDDPVQVAKEMVAELGIPQAAVLEISETISGLARAARVKQDKYLAGIQNPQGHSRVPSQGIITQQPQVGATSEMQQNVMMQQQSMGQITQSSGMMSGSHPSIPAEYMHSQQVVQTHAQHVQQSAHQQSMGVQDQGVQMHAQQLGQHAASIPQHAGQQSVETQGPPPDPQTQHAYGQGGVPLNPQMQPQHIGQSQQLPTDPSLQNTQQSYGHSIPIQSHPSIVRSVSSSGQADVPAPGPSSSFSQLPVQQMQSLQMAQPQANPSGGQNLQMAQPQSNPPVAQHHPENQQQTPAAAYSHPSASHVQMQPQSVSPGMPVHGAGGHTAGSYQSQPMKSQAQQHAPAQFPQNTPHGHGHAVHQPIHTNGTAQAPQQIPNPQSQAVNQVPNQQYGHAVGGQQVVQPQQQQVVQQQQKLSHPPQAQQPTAHQRLHPQIQPAQSSLQQVPQPQNIALQAQQVVSAAAPASRGDVTFPAQTTGIDASTPTNTNSQHHAAGNSQPKSSDSSVNGVLGVPTIDYDDGELDDELLAAELRTLDEVFNKNVMRAKKVFDSRMGNLQRTQHQREAQHQKTLEKHQKERADFEKRMQHEEIEQKRRIEQLRKEWDRRREAVRQKNIAEGAEI